MFGRAAGQLAIGLMLAAFLSGATIASSSLGASNAIALVGAVSALMLVVGLLATVGPARYSLRIPASDALRSN